MDIAERLGLVTVWKEVGANDGYTNATYCVGHRDQAWTDHIFHTIDIKWRGDLPGIKWKAKLYDLFYHGVGYCGKQKNSRPEQVIWQGDHAVISAQFQVKDQDKCDWADPLQTRSRCEKKERRCHK